ncbi:MAG TPA: radical SAM family heme chaperone HemW [Acidiferrobacteraceae bacterium]|nr:radical SAM family heme chaperone HemW [Acidiferrobacteraceae bacterium]
MPNPHPLPPLSLYVHLPWCVRKCPYCDFNSHVMGKTLPEQDYVEALLLDLDDEAPSILGREIQSIFFGGGTPSLFSADAIADLIGGIGARMPITSQAEITLEANPGAVDTVRFKGFRAAGVNRLSIGVQSFDNHKLKALGRIHDSDQALMAIHHAQDAGFEQINVDLMYGLPEQNLEQALQDLDMALAQQVDHLSMYQLTIEPHTTFHQHRPALPDDDSLWAIQEHLQQRLLANGYRQYEVSAYAQQDRQCQHNLNYWHFGDYIGIGAGAHGKLTGIKGIVRRWKTRTPRRYMAGQRLGGELQQFQGDLILEFMMNALRLTHGVPLSLFRQRTGLAPTVMGDTLARATDQDLLQPDPKRLCATPLGQRFLNDLLGLFVDPDNRDNTVNLFASLEKSTSKAPHG